MYVQLRSLKPAPLAGFELSASHENGRFPICIASKDNEFFKIPPHLYEYYWEKGYQFSYLSPKTYKQLTTGKDKVFSPAICETTSDLAFNFLGDFTWMTENVLLSSLAFGQGSLLMALSAFIFLGINIISIPIIFIVGFPLVQTYRYWDQFGELPNRAEVFDVTVNTIISMTKFLLSLTAWTLGTLALPLIFGSVEAVAAVFGGGPLGVIATHVAIGICAGIGSGLVAYAYETSRVLLDYWHSSPTEGRAFPWKEAFLKPISNAFIPYFIGGVLWYGASLLPGLTAVVPTVVTTMINQTLGNAGAIIGAAFSSIVGVGLWGGVRKTLSAMKECVISPAPEMKLGPSIQTQLARKKPQSKVYNAQAYDVLKVERQEREMQARCIAQLQREFNYDNIPLSLHALARQEDVEKTLDYIPRRL